MVVTACPTADELKNYTLGRLSEQDWAAIAEHVESCRQCQAAIATVDDVADTLVTQLREPAPGDSFLNESQCEAALKRARDIKGGTGVSPVEGGTGILPVEGGTGVSPVEGGTGILPVEPENNTGKMPVPLEVPPVPPGVEFKGYEILEELGQGGMGAVYKALHTKLDRVVAIKILSRGRAGDERAIARFEREMKAVGRFDHPHIVRAYDAREIGGAPVLIMEFVVGMDLGRLVQRLGPLPIAEACELVRQACLGLQYIHEQGLVHRDLKPSNLMLTRQGTVKILDLGLARFHFEQSEEEMTNSGQAMGTADYMAPEQASDSHAVDIRADIYSLGCTLYKLLAGSAPFEGSQYKGTFEKMTAHVQCSVPPIENLLPEIPRELAAVLEKMLAKNPADRFAQPADVIEALTPFCANAALPALLVRAEEAKTLSSGEFPARAAKRSGSLAVHSETQPTRRRTSILAAIGLMLFILGFGLGLSLGVLITIKKDGKTTSIEIPDGKNARVNEKGDVMIDMGEVQDKTRTRPIPQPAIEEKKPEQTAQRRTADGMIVPDSYRLGPGDTFTVVPISSIGAGPGGRGGRSVLSTYVMRSTEVAKTGIAYLGPKLGEIKVQGLTLDETEHAIEKKIQEDLDKYNPEVSITVLDNENRSKQGKLPDSYRISPGDKLSFQITGMPEGPFSANNPDLEVQVQPDGYVNIIQVTRTSSTGYIKFNGLTIKEAEKLVRDILIEKIKGITPKVEIMLRTLRKILENPPESHNIDLSTSDGKAAVPPEPYTIMPGDSLLIGAVGTIPDQPIDGIYVVEPAGTVPLGPAYGRVSVKGLSLVEAEGAITKQLQQILRQPEVSVTLAGWVDRSKPQTPPVEHRIAPGDILDIWGCGTITDQPIHGPYLVEPDGQVSLGPAYGRVNLKGQTFEEAEATVLKQLQQILRQPEVSITLGGWRKERKQIEDELMQKANASKTTRARNIPAVRREKTSDVNTTLAPPLLQPTQESLPSIFPSKPLVPVLPGLLQEAQGSGLPAGAGKKDEGPTALPAATVNPVAELKALQGQWKVVHVEKEKDAEFSLSESRAQNGMSVATVNRLKIGQDFVQFVSFEKGNAVTWIYRVDPTARPKTIDLYRSRSENKEGLFALGIYEMEGDLLKICLVNYLPSLKTEQRPKDLTVETGSDKVVITIQRYQPSADEKAVQGKWFLSGQIEDGKVVDKEKSKNNFYINFSDYSCQDGNIDTNQYQIDKIWHFCIYVLDPDKNPKTIKIYARIPDGPVFKNSPEGYGIYKFEGERLWIAYRVGGPAPEMFESCARLGRNAA